MLTKIRRDQLGKVHVPHTGSRLGRPEGMASTVVVNLAGDLYRAGIQVDVCGTERGEFGPAEAREGGQQDQRPVAAPTASATA